MQPQHPAPAHPWPTHSAPALAALRSAQGLSVISVATPPSASRDTARLAIRSALQALLGAWLGQDASHIQLVSSPGQPTRLEKPKGAPRQLDVGAAPLQMAGASAAPVHLALSHMPGLSVAAVSRLGPVGVDVMAIPHPLTADWAQVAQDYLGPPIALMLQNTAAADRAAAFAGAWVQFEARLKCCGLGLTEWTPALARQLAACEVHGLALPAGCIGAAAVPGRWQVPQGA